MTNLKKRVRQLIDVTEILVRRDRYPHQSSQHFQYGLCWVVAVGPERTVQVHPTEQGKAYPPHAFGAVRQIAPTTARQIIACVNSEMVPDQGPVGFTRAAEPIATSATTAISPPIEKRNERIALSPRYRNCRIIFGC